MADDDKNVITVDGGMQWAIDHARAPKNVRWAPKEDITAYELSLALIPLLQGMNAGIEARFSVEDTIANLPEGARRHFEVT